MLSPIVNVKSSWASILIINWHVRSLCKKASQKLNAFARIAYSLEFEQRKLLNAFITSQFSYAPFVWMFHDRKLNNHINRIHEAYQDHNSAFNELLARDVSFKIHDRNLQKLLIEIFRSLDEACSRNHEWNFWLHRMLISS